MIWKTKITRMCKIKYPLIMGAFGGWGKADFASHFSNAGGLGMIAALNFPDPKNFKNDLKLMKSLTSKPFGVNLSLPHHKSSDIPSRKEMEKRYLNYVEIALNEGCNVFTTSGYKANFIGDKVHETGAFWIHKCVLINHAISSEKQGADAVTIVGLEGTGFKNPFTTTTLVNITMAKKLLKIPVIAAGGIGDARGFLAAIMMGAEGVCLGTALMATEECPVPRKFKEKWLNLDIFDEKFYKTIYHYNTKNFMAPSTAIGHHQKILTVKELIEQIFSQAEGILNVWGFGNDRFST